MELASMMLFSQVTKLFANANGSSSYLANTAPNSDARYRSRRLAYRWAS